MASKKYQIFISSTFSDLQDERQLAQKAILDLDHIPSGMEAFPAVDMEQFEYIKKVIDECDYYLLIIGARYGSTDRSGVSFTEREFDYAIEKNKAVIALLHNDVQSLPKKNFDADPTLEIKLAAFRDKVKNGRMVRFWNNRDQLIAAMMQAIIKAIATYPATGWIRGDEVANEDVVRRYMQLRSDYDELLNKYNNEKRPSVVKIDNLAELDEIFTIKYSYGPEFETRADEIHLTWFDILKIIGPNLYSPRTSSVIYSDINSFIELLLPMRFDLSVNRMDVDTVKVHFYALGIIDIQSVETKGGGFQEYVNLTEKGKAELIRAMAVRTDSSSAIISSALPAPAVAAPDD